MKVVQETPTLLVMKQKSNALFGGIFFFVIGLFVIFIARENILVARVAGGAFSLLGIFIMITAKNLTLTVDKNQNKCNFLFAGLLGKKSQDIAFNMIKQIAIEEFITQNINRSNNGGIRNQLNYNLVFYMQDGEGIPISLQNASNRFLINGIPFGGFMKRRNINIALGNKIAAFIGVPFVDRLPPTFKELIHDTIESVNKTKQINENPSTPDNMPAPGTPTLQPTQEIQK